MTSRKHNPSFLSSQLTPAALRRIAERYRRLKEELLALGWIAQGTVTPQPPNAWRLTRKVRAKTVSLALSPQQALLYKEAILNHRKLEALVIRMRALSEEVLQNSVPGVNKRPRSTHPKTTLS